MSATHIVMFWRIVIALVFGLSASGKLLDFPSFEAAFSGFELLSPTWSRWFAVAFVLGELTTVLLMVLGGGLLLVGFLLVIGLLLIFSTALLVVLQRKLHLTCNCFGRSERRISAYDLIRNGLLIMCSLLAVIGLRIPSDSLMPLEIILLGLMALSFVVVVINLADVLKTLWRPFHLGV